MSAKYREVAPFRRRPNARSRVPGVKNRRRRRAASVEQPEIRWVVLDLQIDQPNRMTDASCSLSDELEAERLEPQEYFGIEQRAGMYAEKPHGTAPSRQPSEPRLTWLPNDRREMPP